MSQTTFADSNQHQPNAAIWECMLRIFPEVGTTPTIDDINNPSNAFTLLESLHKAFNTFKFCLEVTVRPARPPPPMSLSFVC